ncbi:ribosome maturation factor RimM [Paenalkalicoccus suaedae]|uniref:Ribosome maturation factor RimM n=1 Tax=Paenalkalicoccus suaedae TaxID=2592382 RepID=A0A859FF19_9BACI|nr:ribosome maturation factor RimM [Paenalkalicoccus suaedae]QKS71460.1 ribosome maturation factor RimM [Paenalkalicoccus suaedae]
MSDFLNVGKIVNTHGIRGEVRVISRTDFPERRYAKGMQLTIFQAGKDPLPVTVESWRQHKQFDLLTFAGYSNVNDVEVFKDSLLKVNTADMQDDELSEGEYYYHDIIGLEVETADGEAIGKITEILSPGANDVWVVKRPDSKKEVLIPYIDDVVAKVDLNQKLVIITPMEGLLD